MILIFSLLMLFDGVTTYHVLKAGGREMNKPLAWLIRKIGKYPALMIVKIIPVAAVWYAVYVDQMPWQLLALLCAGYTWVVWHNWNALKRQQEINRG